MKLSDKILLGFFGVIFIYLTAAFAEVRFGGTLNVVDDGNSIAETVDIPGVTYLVLNDFDKIVNVVGSDRALLEVRSLSGDVLKDLTYQVSGDTLKLWGVKSAINDPFRISVFVPGNVKGITVNTSEAIVRNLEQDQLRVSQNAGRLSMFDSKISRIEMDLSNRSFLDISDTHLDTLSATIEQSQVSINSPVEVFRGSMKEHSSLQLNNLQNIIQLTKDESSVLRLY